MARNRALRTLSIASAQVYQPCIAAWLQQLLTSNNATWGRAIRLSSAHQHRFTNRALQDGLQELLTGNNCGALEKCVRCAG